MPLICYERKNFSEEKLGLITKANLIIAEYQKQGFNLTLRQLYYQFVARDLFPDDWSYVHQGGNKWKRSATNGTKNALPNYTALGNLISDGRIGGLIDWDAIVDRTRGSRANQHWTRPSQIIEGALNTYATNKWENQPNYVEVWVEKEALEDVLASACQPLDVRFFACKGYASVSAMWEAAQRLVSRMEEGKEVHIIHLGDHDPSGVDMSRDIKDRLELFTRGRRVHVRRIALNMAQIKKYNPPPQWAKQTDSRFQSYQSQFGDESWELDALDPAVLVDLIKKHVLHFRDEELWKDAQKNEERGRHTLECLLKYFPDVISFLKTRRQVDYSSIVCQGCGATAANPQCHCADVSNRGILLT
jgi:hypothetical protein